MQPYKIIEIFTDEEARWQGEPLAHAVLEYVRDLKIAARGMVTRGIEGVAENGAIASGRLEVLSYNMPIRITIILPAAEADRVVAALQGMAADGIVAVQEINVIFHKTSGLLLPRHTRVRDIMTTAPTKVRGDTGLDEVARLLLAGPFTGLPVVDGEDRPIGVISQGDLIYRAGLPLRLGLLAVAEPDKVSAVLEALAARPAREVMSAPVVTIGADELVTAAVNLMLEKQVTRLPVVDGDGRLAGNLSRRDIFHASRQRGPDWQALRRQQVTVGDRHCVADIMRRDVSTVRPDTPVADLIQGMASNDIQRIGVVDQTGALLGMISDQDLLAAFAEEHPGIWEYFLSSLPFTERGRQHRHLKEQLQRQTAGEVMTTAIVTVREDAPIDEAIRLMLEGECKRLPVVDAQGKLQGIVSREELLRSGFAPGKTF